MNIIKIQKELSEHLEKNPTIEGFFKNLPDKYKEKNWSLVSIKLTSGNEIEAIYYSPEDCKSYCFVIGGVGKIGEGGKG